MVIYLYKVSAHDPYILYIYIYDHIRGPRPPKKNKGGVADKGNSLFRGGYVQTGAHRPKIGGVGPLIWSYIFTKCSHMTHIYYIYTYMTISGTLDPPKKKNPTALFLNQLRSYIYIYMFWNRIYIYSLHIYIYQVQQYRYIYTYIYIHIMVYIPQTLISFLTAVKTDSREFDLKERNLQDRARRDKRKV